MLTLQEINALMARLDNWALDGQSISKVFNFSNFKEALEFVNKVGEIAENQNHHPDMIISRELVRVSLTTHFEKELTVKDFEVAREIDKLQN